MRTELYRDLESYHAWAMDQVLRQCRSLDIDALTAPLPLGPGSMLATIKHMAGAERIWLDRWQNKSKSGWPDTPDSVDALRALFAELACERANWLESDPESLAAAIQYRDMKGGQHENILGDLVMHVFNHAVHHRSQIVHFLKRQGKIFQGGIDYIFFRIAKPTIPLCAKVAEGCRLWGLEVGETTIPYVAPDLESLVQYCQYGDWAMHRLFDQCQDFSNEQLDQDRGMGIGSIRKSLLHIYDAECFWQANWDETGSRFPSTPTTTSIDEMAKQWSVMSEMKAHFLERTDRSQLGRKVIVDVGGGPMEFHLSESLLQLSVHGTLHRAQITNMIRTAGKSPEALDFVVWLRQS